MKNKFLIIAIGIFLLFSFTALVSAANSDGLLQIWRNSTTGANVSTIDNNGNLYALGNLNLSGIYYGDGSGLTNLNVSAIDTSGLVPYTGSNKNIALGNYNFSIGTSELFVNSNTGNVGLGLRRRGVSWMLLEQANSRGLFMRMQRAPRGVFNCRSVGISRVMDIPTGML